MSTSIIPPPGARRTPRSRRCARRCGRAASCSRVAAGASTGSSPGPAVALERRLDRDQAAGVLRVRAGVVRGARRGARSRSVIATGVPYPARDRPEPQARMRRGRRRRRRRRPARRARGGGRGGARSTLVSRKPLAESSSFWAQGGLAAALAADDSPERHAADTLRRRPRPLPHERGRGAHPRGAGGGRAADEPRGPLRHRARRRARARASRAATRRGGSSTPAAARPGARSPRGSPSWSPPRSAIEVLEGVSARRALERRRALPRGAHRRRRDRRARRPC